MSQLGILAYGSLTCDPGDELPSLASPNTGEEYLPFST
jgi:hypothetical protein